MGSTTRSLKVAIIAHFSKSILLYLTWIITMLFLQKVYTISRSVTWAASRKLCRCPLATKLHPWIQIGSMKLQIGKNYYYREIQGVLCCNFTGWHTLGLGGLGLQKFVGLHQIVILCIKSKVSYKKDVNSTHVEISITFPCLNLMIFHIDVLFEVIKSAKRLDV